MTAAQAYVTALSFENQFQACAQLHWIMSLLPPKYRKVNGEVFAIPKIPDEAMVEQNTIGPDGRQSLRRWVIEWQEKVGMAISQFIEEEYKNIGEYDN